MFLHPMSIPRPWVRPPCTRRSTGTRSPHHRRCQRHRPGAGPGLCAGRRCRGRQLLPGSRSRPDPGTRRTRGAVRHGGGRCGRCRAGRAPGPRRRGPLRPAGLRRRQCRFAAPGGPGRDERCAVAGGHQHRPGRRHAHLPPARATAAGGAMVAVSSIAGGVYGWEQHAHYAAAKAGVPGLCRAGHGAGTARRCKP